MTTDHPDLHERIVRLTEERDAATEALASEERAHEITSGAYEALATERDALRAERDAARAEPPGMLVEAVRLLRDSGSHSSVCRCYWCERRWALVRAYDALPAVPGVTTDPLPVRTAARQRRPLDGSDAQALEHAVTMTERERDTALTALKRLREAVSDIHGIVGRNPFSGVSDSAAGRLLDVRRICRAVEDGPKGGGNADR
jgi:hypothetical protein